MLNIDLPPISKQQDELVNKNLEFQTELEAQTQELQVHSILEELNSEKERRIGIEKLLKEYQYNLERSNKEIASLTGK